MTAPTGTLAVDPLTELGPADLENLCEAADAGIAAGGGFAWLKPPSREAMEAYWRGVLLVPGRQLFVGRVDGTIAGSAQLLPAARNNEAQAHAAQLLMHFVAPWARGQGLGRRLAVAVEIAARKAGYSVLNLDVRQTQTAAIHLYRGLGYRHWGTHPVYARVEDRLVAGLFFCKALDSSVPAP
jgi:ribosomal protein S18 acetylase RimI-like enzyme